MFCKNKFLWYNFDISIKGLNSMTKTKKIVISFVLCFAVLLVFASIFDLQISRALADIKPGQYFTTNFFAIIFEVGAEMIMFLLCSCAGIIIFLYFRQNPLQKKWLNVLFLVLSAIISVASMWYGLIKTLYHLADYTNFGLAEFLSRILGKLAIVGVSIMICAIIFVLLSKITKENIAKLFHWAIIVLAVSATITLLTQGAKFVVGRTRFRAMVYEGDTNFEHYSPWFMINNNKFASTSPYFEEYFKSFPSGHASMGATILLLTFLPNFVDISKKWKISLNIISIIYILLVMISRLIAGAHFVSDVLIGAGITIFVSYLAIYIYNKIKHKKLQN